MAALKNSLLAIGFAVSCANATVAQDKPSVVAVHKALYDFAEHLLEDDADVVFPIPAGVDPSFWRPAIADISLIQSADLILLNGAGFATWVDRVSLPRSRLVNTSTGIKDQFIVTKSITHSHGDGGEHSHEGIATYTWLDPILAIAQAEAVASAAIGRNLAPSDTIEARLELLRSKLTELDTTTQEKLSDAKGIAMIATHPRYQYFARRYSLSISSLEWEAGAMPTKEQLAELESLANDLGARVLIWEAEPPRDAVVAAEALGLKSVVFDPFASESPFDTYADAFSSAVSGIADAVNGMAN